MSSFRTMMGAALGLALAAPCFAQEGQFIPVLSYRTGAYAANGIPWANGFVDYLELVNQRDGGINGVRIVYEECETGYTTDRSVECYERLKGRGPTGAAYFNPLSTGAVFALTEKAPVDKISIITMGYGRSESRDGGTFTWNFPMLGTYWTGANVAIQHIAKEMGGMEALRGKKIALVYHDSPFGKEPIPVLEAMSRTLGFQFTPIPVTAPGVEQKSQWLQIRRERPDYVVLWGWGVMNSTAIQEAAAVNYPRDKMLGVWWAGAEPDVTPGGAQSVGYKALMLQHGAQRSGVHADMERFLYAKGLGKAANPADIGQVLYNRGMVNSMLGVEGIRKAQEKYGNKPLTGEQIRWGLENLELTEARIKELGFEGLLRPIRISCQDHEGARAARVQQWNGTAWTAISDWYEADDALLQPMVRDAAARYARERNLTARDCAKES